MLRHYLYDSGILQSHSFSTPKTIIVGNLNLGGTGKSPHTRFLVNFLLQKKYSVAILSRGYKRATTGFIEVSLNHTVKQVGDEPLMQKAYFKQNVSVFVDENRVQAIQLIKAKHPNIQVVILDDAFQHRKLKAGYSILLTPAKRTFLNDFLVPKGNLRDLPTRVSSANLIIATNYSNKFKQNVLNLQAVSTLQPTICSWITYGEVQSENPNFTNLPLKGFDLAVITGIANPNEYLEHLSLENNVLKHFKFKDHHAFTVAEIELFIDFAKSSVNKSKFALITTEKDWHRLMYFNEFKIFARSNNVGFLPIEVTMFEEHTNLLQNNILNYVESN